MVQMIDVMKAERMALQVAERAGIVFLAATPGREPGSIKLTVQHDLLRGIPKEQRRFFFISDMRAARVLKEIKITAGGMVINGAVILRLPILEIDQLVKACATRINVEMIEASDLAAALKRMSARICAIYGRMCSSGEMKKFNRGYRAARLQGVKVPSYERWLTEKLLPIMRLDSAASTLAALGL